MSPGTVVAAALERIEGSLRGARAGRDPEFLHQLRVGLRRLRSALQAFRALPDRASRKPLERSARALARALGAVRDWDVLLIRIDAMPGASPVAARIRRERQAAQRELRQVLSPARWRRFLEQGHAVRAKAAQVPAPPPAFARKAMDRAYRKALKRARRLDWSSASERHALRIRVKRLRYTCEIHAASYPGRPAAAYVAALKRLQDILGELNDIRVGRKLLKRTETLRPVIERRLAAREAALLRRLAPAWRSFESRPRFWRLRG
jgi:triphosphatase